MPLNWNHKAIKIQLPLAIRTCSMSCDPLAIDQADHSWMLPSISAHGKWLWLQPLQLPPAEQVCPVCVKNCVTTWSNWGLKDHSGDWSKDILQKCARIEIIWPLQGWRGNNGIWVRAAAVYIGGCSQILDIIELSANWIYRARRNVNEISEKEIQNNSKVFAMKNWHYHQLRGGRW